MFLVVYVDYDLASVRDCFTVIRSKLKEAPP